MRWVFKLLSSCVVFCLFQFSTPVFAIHILPAVCDPIFEKIAQINQYLHPEYLVV
jgi:hypothetical protein